MQQIHVPNTNYKVFINCEIDLNGIPKDKLDAFVSALAIELEKNIREQKIEPPT